jgi:hypothetical protein
MEIVTSKGGVRIRLTMSAGFTLSRTTMTWPDIMMRFLGTVEDPDLILRGYGGARIAVKAFGRRKYLMVIYREVGGKDGFIITAYFTSEVSRRRILWRRGQPWRKR